MELNDLINIIHKFNYTNEYDNNSSQNLIINKLPNKVKDQKGNQHELSQHNWKINVYKYRQDLKDARNGKVKKNLLVEESIDDVNNLLTDLELKKDWNRIKIEFKKLLVKNYLDKMRVDSSILNIVKNNLNDKLNDKSLKQKDVVYDNEKKEILSIPFLEKKYNYTIQ